MKKKIILMMAFACAIILPLQARTDKQGNFVKIPPFARAVGMAEAFSAVSDGSYGLYYNPAGMSSILGYEGQFSYVAWFSGINYIYIGLINPDPILSWGKIGLSFSWFQVNSREEPEKDRIIDWRRFTDPPGYYGNYSVSFGSAFDISQALGSGINLRWQYEYSDRGSIYSNLAADIGLMLKLKSESQYFRAALGLSSSGQRFKTTEVGLDVPDTVTFGVSERFGFPGGTMLLSGEAVLEPWQKTQYCTGAEYLISNIFSIRAGYKYGTQSGPSFGLGISHREFELDYACSLYDGLGAAHLLSIVFSWGTPPAGLNIAPGVVSTREGAEFGSIILMPEIREKEAAKKAWFNVYDADGKKKLGTLEIKDTGAAKTEWDLSLDGKKLGEGGYRISVEAEYVINGTSESYRQPFEIDNSGPEVDIKGEPQFLKPGGGNALLIPSTFTLFASDKNGISKWELAVKDEGNRVFFSQKGEGDLPAKFVWDGRGAGGAYVDTGRMYYYSLIAYDRLGNRAETAPKFQLILMKEIKLTFSSDALFAPGKADMKIENFKKIQFIKPILEKYKQSDIIVEGYTDSGESTGGNFTDLKALSAARAETVKFFMINMLGIEAARIKPAGYGDERPVDTAGTPEAKEKNRRVEVIIRSVIYK
jgi:outer membrane protein OmpA-like peptidoglycan-associated protein